jgi:hypothetical protein
MMKKRFTEAQIVGCLRSARPQAALYFLHEKY